MAGLSRIKHLRPFKIHGRISETLGLNLVRLQCTQEMESNFPEVLDARGDQGAMEIKSPRNQGLLHSDVDYNLILYVTRI